MASTWTDQGDRMKAMTKDDAAGWLTANTLDDFVNQRCDELKVVSKPCAIPEDSASKTALAKFLSYLLLRQPEVCVYLTGWSLRPTAEHLDLLYGYRCSRGEMRPLSEAPLHVFDQSETDALASILCLVFYFALEAWVFDTQGKTVIRISHDGRMEVRADEHRDIVDFASEPEKYLKALGARAS
ncbi:MAG: hypothetical protein WA532_06210 [Candidatus Korobacteraceae bacterium]